MKNNKFTSTWGFILTTVGSAVGMANVWGFPYKLAANGGGAFLLVYLFFIAIFSYFGLSAEYAVGRYSETGTLGSYEKAWSHIKLPKVGKAVGILPLLGSICIAIGYAVIISYVLKSLFQSLTGSLMTVDSEVWFKSFSSKNFSVIPFHFIVIVATLLTCIKGASSIEKANKIMMPLFFILFVVLAFRVAFLPKAFEGYKFMFTPDWKMVLHPKVLVGAMGQAFFSLSITGSGMIVCGAYLNKDEDIVAGAKQTAIFDTIAALVAALVMIPALFSFSENPEGGPGLLFVTLPKILQNMKGGRIFALALYLAVLFGGISSLQNMFEVVCESILHNFKKLNRKTVLAFIGLVAFIPGIFMEPIGGVKGAILGGWGPWMDLVSIYIIPMGATLGAFSWFWIMDKNALINEINTGSKTKYTKTWYYLGKFIYVPMAAILCFVALYFKVAF
ncbi:NSS family neurotransmitter:Na+ symporter [Peptoniphilus koenoeneniae]|uniref:NSS family neurotransmitter:Na+ symporter n=1 Tax=Peptoniphilus koenoeneniae TaxID=507751 RepID=A0ABU0AVE7_9FIRM|nr:MULTISPECIES: sodium-dependent transporter [Peptoniphilus]ERT56239.1 sodium:neurotransmitter symporter domain protein [Peptoniphilus sp. BV3C26]MDQ0275244.1 NSS family neurotransmitter:Na+ symporter [Peptoniphilus koenoeneniae]